MTGGTHAPEMGRSWNDDMMRRGSAALLLVLWREHDHILMRLRERGLIVRAPGDRGW